MNKLKRIYWWFYFIFKVGYFYMFKIGCYADIQFSDTHWKKFKTLLYYAKLFVEDMMTEE